MTGKQYDEMTEQEIELAKGDQRAYIRENLNGTEYFFKRAGLDREQIVSELGVEVTKFGFNKDQLDKNIEERNAAIKLFAIEHDLSSIMEQAEGFREYQQQQDNHRNLQEKMDLMGMSRSSEPIVDEEVPLTEHEQVLQKLDDIKYRSMTPAEKQKLNREKLTDGINKLMGYK